MQGLGHQVRGPREQRLHRRGNEQHHQRRVCSAEGIRICMIFLADPFRVFVRSLPLRTRFKVNRVGVVEGGSPFRGCSW